ncbi:MAG: serine/threonine-protein kinase [Polyangiaceae bacterium]
MQLAPDVVIAERFKLQRLLGQGGMGSVWLATHLGLDIPCAVKFIEGEFAQMAEAQARFEREAKAAASLRSPHVVQILDHGIFEGTPYIAMELLDGEEWGKRLHRVGRMPPAEVIKIVSEVGRALTKAHAVGIVHRDLKPENIYLVKDDDREIAKVLDFGIAKATGNEVSGSNTKTGAMLGTPYYMSPEQAQGVKAVDHRSDLWSLGVIVFQAITGRLPFESEALGDLLVRIIVAPVPRAADFVNDLPPGFEQWWAKASQRDPALRFQSSKEFCESLAASFGQGAAHWGADGNLAPAAPMGGPGQFGITPQPFGMTPQPLGLTPQPFGATGQPVAVTPQPYGATGMPGQAVTQGGVPGLPAPKKTGMLIGIGVGAAAAVILAVVGFSMSGKKSADTAPSAAAPPPPTTLVSAAPVPPTPPVPPPEATHETLAPTPAPVEPAPVAAATPAPKAHTGGGGAAPAAPRPAAPAAPAAPKKPAKVDLGI